MLCHGIPDIPHLEQWAALNIPFEYQDFMLPDILDQQDLISRKIAAYLSIPRDRREDVIHGPFLDITIHSSDRAIRAVSDQRIRQVCDIAMALEVKAIVLHTNLIPNFYVPSYRQGWIDRNESYLRQLLADYPGLWVYMENMFDEEPDCLAALAQRMAGERFGVCLDIAHAHISKTPIRQWMDVCAPYVAHYHINDNHGLLDEHLPLGLGNIPWETVLLRLRPDASVLLEVGSLEKHRQSLAYLEANSL